MKRKLIGLKVIKKHDDRYYVLSKGKWFSFTKEEANLEIKKIKEELVEEVIPKAKLKELRKKIKHYYEKLYFIQEVEKMKEEG